MYILRFISYSECKGFQIARRTITWLKKNSKIQFLHSLYIICMTDEELLYNFILINKYVCPWQLRNKT